MTEALLQKLEEKMMLLLSEVEDLRKDVQHFKAENTALKFERENHARKLHDMLSLLDAVNVVDTAMANANSVSHSNFSPMKPTLVQGAVEHSDKEFVQSS